jgi:hypothetical protein
MSRQAGAKRLLSGDHVNLLFQHLPEGISLGSRRWCHVAMMAMRYDKPGAREPFPSAHQISRKRTIRA